METRSNSGRVQPLFQQIFGIDVRALAALRIALALLLLTDLAIRSTDLIDHYTDVGILPRPARITVFELREETSARFWWSIHMLNGTAWFQGGLFIVAAALALCLLLGYRTRLVTLLSWLMLVSLHSRLPSVLQGGDVLLRSLLCWSLFLPLGAVASVDHAFGPRRPERPPAAALSLASFALLLQVAIVYWCSAAAKSDPAWWRDSSAVYYALQFDLYVKPLGIRLREYPRCLEGLTFCTYWFEWIGPALAFLPWRTGFWRLLVVAGFWGFHLGLALTLHLGLFSYVAMTAWLVFLPAAIWDRLAIWTSSVRSAIVRRVRPRWDRLAPRLFRRPAPAWFVPGWGSSVCVAGLLGGVLYVNYLTLLPAGAARHGPRWPHHVIAVLRLEQEWTMFAPCPTRDDGWFVVRGVLVDGSEVNLWEPERDLTWVKPQLPSAHFPNHRWRKYLSNFRWNQDTEQLSCFSDWLRARWDDSYSGGRPEREVELVQIIFFLEETPPPGKPPRPLEPEVLWHWNYKEPDEPGAEETKARTETDKLDTHDTLPGIPTSDKDVGIRFHRIITQVSRTFEGTRKAAPISSLVEVLLGVF